MSISTKIIESYTNERSVTTDRRGESEKTFKHSAKACSVVGTRQQLWLELSMAQFF